jgi:chaperonin GroES
MIMKIKPIGKRVLIRKIKEEIKTKNGLIVPDSMKDRDRYEIVEVGNGHDFDEDYSLDCMPFEKGDVIYLERYAGYDIKNGEEQLIVVKIGDIMAIEEEG